MRNRSVDVQMIKLAAVERCEQSCLPLFSGSIRDRDDNEDRHLDYRSGRLNRELVT